MAVSYDKLIRFFQIYHITELTRKQIKELSLMLEIDSVEFQKKLKRIGIGEKTLQQENYPLPDEYALKTINKTLAAIRQWANDTFVEAGSFAPERVLSKVQNVYEFVAFFALKENGAYIDEATLRQEAESWKKNSDNHSTEKLIGLLEKWSVTIHANPGWPFSFFRDVEHTSLLNIFVKGQIKTKAQYDFYLSLQESGIIDDLLFIRNSLPSSLWRYPMLYKSLINTMASIESNNQNLTVAQCTQIYNHYIFGMSVSDYIDL